MPLLNFTDKEWKIHLESVDDLEQDYLKKHIVKEETIEYVIVYQKPKGYGYWYTLERFNTLESAIAYLKEHHNPVHDYEIVRTSYTKCNIKGVI